MFRILYAESDATFYEHESEANTGLDEVLEVGKRQWTAGADLVKSRSAIKFNMTEVQNTLTKYSVNLDSCKFMLQLYTTNACELPAEYTVDANILAQPWINGTGMLSSNPLKTNGARWTEPAASWSLDSQTYTSQSVNVDGNLWISSSQEIRVNGSSLYVSGSGNGGSWLWQSGSGTFNLSYFNQSFFHQPGLTENESFSYRVSDINMDVTDAIKLWISGSGGRSIHNNGFLLKFSDTDESNSNEGIIRFFSRETDTIYVPKLVMYFDNSEYSSSLDQIDIDSYLSYCKLKPTYKDIEVSKIRIYARDKFPRKSPTNKFPIETVKRLPNTTYYAIRDAATDEYIIPFDDIYNKVSCDSTSNFIHVDMNNFMPERYYRLEFKITDGVTEHYIDDDMYFKVVR